MKIGLLPIYNEEKNIIEVLSRLEKQVDYIVMVNDGSSDRTGFLISDWIKDRKNIQYLSFHKNKGMSYALLQGFNFISGQYKKRIFSGADAVITVDADGQHDPEKINNIYEYFNKNILDVLIAKRNFLGYPKHRVFGNKLVSLLTSYLGNFKFSDIECGFKILKVSFINDLLKYYIGYRYSCACEIGIIASLLGYKIDNDYSIKVAYFKKKGPGFIDFLNNLILCFVAAVRIKTKINRIKRFPPVNKHRHSIFNTCYNAK